MTIQQFTNPETITRGVSAGLRARQLFNRRTMGQDISAGLVLGIESVPDGLAQGLLALVNPVFGLYAYMVGTFTGAFFTSSVYMAVQVTGAMALIVASVPQVHHPGYGDDSVFALAILTGLMMLGAGLLKLGSLLRFVPNAVMTGFINAVAVLIILGQLSNVTGYNAVGPNKLMQTINLLGNMDQVDLPTLMVGLATIFLIINLEKTRLKALGLVAAMIVASMLVPLFKWDSVATLNDIVEIPHTLPRMGLPPISVFPALLIPAFSLAFVGLVQGAGISRGFINPDGKYPNASGDFVGQGIANLAAGLFQGLPVGGSMSATALATTAGARSRFSNIVAGITMGVVILLFGDSVGSIALPSMGGLLIVIGFRTLKPERAEMVWRTGSVQQVVMAITFAACLLIPLQYAVVLGVSLAVILFVFEQSNKITVKEWKWQPGEFAIEGDPPAVVPASQVTMLMPYGSLFFAAAPLVEEQLPKITEETHHAAVILGLRDTDLGSTFLDVLERYAKDLKAHDSRLMLAGVTYRVSHQLDQTGVARVIGRENIFLKTDRVGEAATQAWYAAQRWVEEQPKHRGQSPAIHLPEREL